MNIVTLKGEARLNKPACRKNNFPLQCLAPSNTTNNGNNLQELADLKIPLDDAPSPFHTCICIPNVRINFYILVVDKFSLTLNLMCLEDLITYYATDHCISR